MQLKEFKELTKKYKIIDSVRIIVSTDTGDISAIMSYINDCGIKFRTVTRSINPMSFRRRNKDGLIEYHMHFYLLEDSKFYRIRYNQNIKGQPRYIRYSDFQNWVKTAYLDNKLRILINE